MTPLNILIACEESGVAHNAKDASKTFTGVASAMAEQWSQFLLTIDTLQE